MSSRSFHSLLLFLFVVICNCAAAQDLEGIHHLPLVRKRTTRSLSAISKRADGAIGLGNYYDITYSVLVDLGGNLTPLILDTGSSDLWAMSSSCTKGCTTDLPLYSQTSLKPSNLDVKLYYGDSQSGTHAFGIIGTETVGLTQAKLNIGDQHLAAVNDTNTGLLDAGAAGILGMGFPLNSLLWSQVFKQQHGGGARVVSRELPQQGATGMDLRRSTFPELNTLFPDSPSPLHSRDSANDFTHLILSSFSTIGPFLPRLIQSTQLSRPMFSVSLQRNTIDAGSGNVGQLSLGSLPPGITSDEMTWVPLRSYSLPEGGLRPPDESPDEKYALTWEIFIGDVFLDGEKLPRSKLVPENIQPSALIDTGNSLIRGPEDVINEIQKRISGGAKGFVCDVPHTLEFEIGGQRFPVDPRDLIAPEIRTNADSCITNLAPTDPPVSGQGYLYSWSLGDPFLKGLVTSFYYGNLTFPSLDPPKIGLKSSVPKDAKERLGEAVKKAEDDERFPMRTDPAPAGLSTQNASGSPKENSAHVHSTLSFVWALLPVLSLFVALS